MYVKHIFFKLKYQNNNEIIMENTLIIAENKQKYSYAYIY